MRLSRCAFGLAVVTILGATGAAEADKVKIGVLTDMSSAYADLAGKGSVKAAEMAIADFGGKVLGEPVELVSADHQNKADIAASIARKWFDNEGVDMITDLTNSAVALAVQDITKQRKKLNLITSTGTTLVTNKNCSPYGAHWTYDNYGLSSAPARAMVRAGGKTWFFVTADYAFGHNLEDIASKIVIAEGGKVIGRARHPLNTTDFSSYLLQAQASGADVIGIANTGTDFSNFAKQAQEFGITRKQKLAVLFAFITDIHALGLKSAQGMQLTTAFYWDRNDETRAWAKRFFETQKLMPTMIHAGTYSAVTHYLKAVQALGAKDSDQVMAQMRKTRVTDLVWKNAYIRDDGRMVHDMYFVEVKSPAESRYPWDYYKILTVIPGEQAFQPLSESECPLVKK
jgi:branched-chain amino acid transport system substrate-binding protein